MRTPCLCLFVLPLLSASLSGQSLRLSGPPLVTRQSHVGDGALIGATVGGFLGTIAGLADWKHVCPPHDWVCGDPVGPIIGALGGLGVGSVVGGATGALVGVFVRTSPGEAELGLRVVF